MTPPLGEAIAFAAIGAVILGAALASALARRTFHSVMSLGVVLVAVAALYILLGSPLVGVIQLLVYVGGILTLFVFAVMFVAGDDQEEGLPADPARGAWTGPVAASAATLLGLGVAYAFTTQAYGWAAALAGGKEAAPVLAPLLGFVAGSLLVALAAVLAIVAGIGIRHVLSHWSALRLAGAASAALVLGLLLAAVAATASFSVTPQALAHDAGQVKGDLATFAAHLTGNATPGQLDQELDRLKAATTHLAADALALREGLPAGTNGTLQGHMRDFTLAAKALASEVDALDPHLLADAAGQAQMLHGVEAARASAGFAHSLAEAVAREAARTQESANGVATVTDALFGPLVVPFEVLGVLLTAVMIGALTIARPLGVHGREESSQIHPNLAVVEPASAPRSEEAQP